MISDREVMSQCEQELRDEFYRRMEKELVTHVRRHITDDFLRRDLMRRSGLRDERLIEELIRIGITSESLVAVRLVPLVMVAWSDDQVTTHERESIKIEAAKMGIGEDTIPGKLLDAWLAVQPPREMAFAWKRYARLLMESMSGEMSRVYVGELQREMAAIARASGGKLGVGRISEKEQLVIDRFTRLVHTTP